MPKILSRTELAVLEQKAGELYQNYSHKHFMFAKSEHNRIMEDLKLRIANYQNLAKNPTECPRYNRDAFEVEMDVLRDHTTRLKYLEEKTDGNNLFKSNEPDEVYPFTYSPKHEIISLLILIVIAVGASVWLM